MPNNARIITLEHYLSNVQALFPLIFEQYLSAVHTMFVHYLSNVWAVFELYLSNAQAIAQPNYISHTVSWARGVVAVTHKGPLFPFLNGSLEKQRNTTKRCFLCFWSSEFKPEPSWAWTLPVLMNLSLIWTLEPKVTEKKTDEK
jgi:hypothetical protein